MMAAVPWDAETERRIAEALAVTRPPRRRIRVVDHHPWVPPPQPPARATWKVAWRRARRWLLSLVAFALALEVVRQAGRLSGLARLGLLTVALVILFVSFLGRRPG